MTRLNDADLQEIIRLLDDSDYDELEVETDAFRLVVRRSATDPSGWTRSRKTLTDPKLVEARPAEGAQSGGGAEAEVGGLASLAPGLAAITAPMVGTFYRAPRPGADPFVEPGAPVEADSVVAIIEVMKLMYSVVAGVSGQVEEVCAENGQLVQKGQRLILVRTDSEAASEKSAG